LGLLTGAVAIGSFNGKPQAPVFPVADAFGLPLTNAAFGRNQTPMWR